MFLHLGNSAECHSCRWTPLMDYPLEGLGLCHLLDNLGFSFTPGGVSFPGFFLVLGVLCADFLVLFWALWPELLELLVLCALCQQPRGVGI